VPLPPDSVAARPADRSLALLCALLFGAMLNLTLVVAGLKELVVDRLGGSERDAALFFTLEMVAYVLFGPLWGLASDRTGRRRIFVVGGFAASAGAYLLLARVESLPWLLAIRFLQGGASIAGWSTAMAMVFDAGRPEERPRRAGLAGASIILGVGAGAPLGGVLSHALGPRAPLVAAAAAFALLALAALLLADPPRRLGERPSPRQIARLLARRPRLLVPAAFYLLERLSVGMFVVLFPLHLARTAGASPAERGLYLALFLFPFALGQVLTYRLTRRFGALRPLAAGAALYGLGFSALGFLGAGWLLVWMVVLGTLAAVIFPPTLALVAEGSEPSTRASAMAAFNLAGSLGFAIGPMLGVGLAGAIGGAAAFVGAGAPLVVAAALLALLSRRAA